MLTFRVDGKPVPQGNHRATRDGRIYETSKGHARWRKAVFIEARVTAMNARNVLQEDVPIPKDVPVVVWARYTFFTADDRRWGKPKTSAPDVDKLNRAIGDSLEDAGVVWNDAQIVAWPCCPAKVYGERPGVEVRVYTLSEWESEHG